MLVCVGPIPSAAVLAYTRLAREQLGALRSDPRLAGTLSDDLVGLFESLHDEWDDLASRSDEFVWRRELEVDEAQWIVHGFFRIVEVVSQEGRVSEEVRLETRPFYQALVTNLLDALGRESDEYDAFVANLRSHWPYLLAE